MFSKNASRPFECFDAFPKHLSLKSELLEALRCVKCNQFPNPDYVMVCKENHHFTCGRCAFPKINYDDAENCCSAVNLVKKKYHFLKPLLQHSYWTCGNRENECKQVIVGHKWNSHMKICSHGGQYKCHYPDCMEKTFTVKHAVDHIVKTHGGWITDFEDGTSAAFNILFDKPVDQMDKSTFDLISFQKHNYLFSVYFRGGVVYMWLWELGSFEPESAKNKVYYDLVLKPARKSDYGDVTYHGACIPYEIPPMEVIEDGNCLAIPVTHLAKNYVGETLRDLEVKESTLVEINIKNY